MKWTFTCINEAWLYYSFWQPVVLTWAFFKTDLLHHITVELYGVYMCMVSLQEKFAYISIKFYFPIFIPFITLNCQHSFELLIDHFQRISFFSVSLHLKILWNCVQLYYWQKMSVSVWCERKSILLSLLAN